MESQQLSQHSPTSQKKSRKKPDYAKKVEATMTTYGLT